MAKGVTVEVIGIDGAIKKFQEISDKFQDDLKVAVIGSAFKIETDAKRRAPSDTGRLRSSIQTEIRKAGFEAVVFSDVNYAEAVEVGTKPHFPPPGALAGWARRHGMSGKEYLIARAISRRGTQAQPFMRPAYEHEKDNFINTIKNIARNIE